MTDKRMAQKQLVHSAFDQDEMDVRGSARCVNEAMHVLHEEYRKAVAERGHVPGRVFRFKLIEEVPE